MNNLLSFHQKREWEYSFEDLEDFLQCERDFTSQQSSAVVEMLRTKWLGNMLHTLLSLSPKDVSSIRIKLGKKHKVKKFIKSLKLKYMAASDLPTILPIELNSLILEYADAAPNKRPLHPSRSLRMCSSHCDGKAMMIAEAVFGSSTRRGMADYTDFRSWRRENFTSFENIFSVSDSWKLYHLLHKGKLEQLHFEIDEYCGKAANFKVEDHLRKLYDEISLFFFPQHQYFKLMDALDELKVRPEVQQYNLEDTEILCLHLALSRANLYCAIRDTILKDGNCCRWKLFDHYLRMGVYKVAQYQAEERLDFPAFVVYHFVPFKKTIDYTATYSYSFCLTTCLDPVEASTMYNRETDPGSLLSFYCDGYNGFIADCRDFCFYESDTKHMLLPMEELKFIRVPPTEDSAISCGMCRVTSGAEIAPVLSDPQRIASLPRVVFEDLNICEYFAAHSRAAAFDGVKDADGDFSDDDGKDVLDPNVDEFNYYWFDTDMKFFRAYPPCASLEIELMYQRHEDVDFDLSMKQRRWRIVIRWKQNEVGCDEVDIIQKNMQTGFQRKVFRKAYCLREKLRHIIYSYLPLAELINLCKKDDTQFEDTELIKFGSIGQPEWATSLIAFNWGMTWEKYQTEISPRHVVHHFSYDKSPLQEEKKEEDERSIQQIEADDYFLNQCFRVAQDLKLSQIQRFQDKKELNNIQWLDILYALSHLYRDVTKVLISFRYGLHQFALDTLDKMFDTRGVERVLKGFRKHNPDKWQLEFVPDEIGRVLSEFHIHPGSIFGQASITGNFSLVKRMLLRGGTELDKQQQKHFQGVSHFLDFQRHAHYTALAIAFLYADVELLDLFQIFGLICPNVATECLKSVKNFCENRHKVQDVCERFGWNFSRDLRSIPTENVVSLFSHVRGNLPLTVSVFEQMQRDYNTDIPQLSFRFDAENDQVVTAVDLKLLDDEAEALANRGHELQSRRLVREVFVFFLFRDKNYQCRDHTG